MNIAVASAESNTSRLVSLAVEALRAVRWPQFRGAMLFGLVVTVVSTLIFMGPILNYARTMPLSMLMLGAAISDQVKALCLLAAVVIADRAVDDGAHRRSAYILAALIGCGLGILVTQPLDWAWRVFVLPDAWPTERPCYCRRATALCRFSRKAKKRSTPSL